MAESGKLCTAPRPWERISESEKSWGYNKTKDHAEILAKIALRHEAAEFIRRIRNEKN